MKFRIFPPKRIKLIIVTIILLLFISLPTYAALWGNKVDTQDLQRIITELRIYDDPDLPYYNEIFRLYYHNSEELLDALNKKIEITQQVMKLLDEDIKKEELGNLTYGRYLLNAINEKELVEMGIKTGSPGQANGEYFSKLSENLADWNSQLNKFLITKIIGATCTAIGAPAFSIGISTLGLFSDLSIIGISINKLNEVWYEKAFWSYMQFRNDHNFNHYDAWKGYAETQVKYILNLSLLSLEKQKKARKAIEENFESLWNKYGDHIVNNKLDEGFKSQQRESLKILLLYALGSEPHPVITSPLKITTDSPYYVGDTINAEFTIANIGTLPINLSVLTIGGRDNDNQVADFSHRQNIILKPIESYDYKGTLTLNKVGNYHFFCTYQTPDDEWNTNVEVGSKLTDADRTEDISVEEKEIPTEAFLNQTNHEKLSRGFVKLNNDFAVAIVRLEKNEYNRITAILAIKKLSPSDFKHDESVMLTLDLIDDQGEIFHTIKSLFPGWTNYYKDISYKLPKGFIITVEYNTEAPALALNHIKTINLLGQKVNLIELALEPLENFDCIVHATEDVQLDKWLDFKIDGIIDNKLKNSVGSYGYYLKGTIGNSSYEKKKDVKISLIYQNKNGELYQTDGAQCEISGKSSKSFAISLHSSHLSKIEDVRAFIVNVRKYDKELEGYKQVFFIMPMHEMPFYYPPTIHYIGSSPKCWKITYDDIPRLKIVKSSTNLNNFRWKTSVYMKQLCKRFCYKFTVSFDKGEGTLIGQGHHATGNFIEQDSLDYAFGLEWTITFPDEATNANFHIEQK